MTNNWGAAKPPRGAGPEAERSATGGQRQAEARASAATGWELFSFTRRINLVREGLGHLHTACVTRTLETPERNSKGKKSWLRAHKVHSLAAKENLGHGFNQWAKMEP